MSDLSDVNFNLDDFNKERKLEISSFYKSVNRILIMNVLFFIVFSIFCNISYANEDDASERLSSLTDLGATILPFDISTKQSPK